MLLKTSFAQNYQAGGKASHDCGYEYHPSSGQSGIHLRLSRGDYGAVGAILSLVAFEIMERARPRDAFHFERNTEGREAAVWSYGPPTMCKVHSLYSSRVSVRRSARFRERYQW